MKHSIFYFFIVTFLFSSCSNSAPEMVEEIVPIEVDDTWKRVIVGSLGLSVDFPFEFKEKNLRTEIDPSINHMVKSMETFMHEQNTSVYMLNSVEYQNDVELSITSAVDGGVNGMLGNMNGTLLSRKDEKKYVSGHEGIFTSGTISSSVGTMYFQNLAVMVGQKLYQVMGINMVEDKTGEATITRFIDSAEIKA